MLIRSICSFMNLKIAFVQKHTTFSTLHAIVLRTWFKFKRDKQNHLNLQLSDTRHNF